MKHTIAFILAAVMLFCFSVPVFALVDENGCFVDFPAADCGIESLTACDFKAVLGEDVTWISAPGGQDIYIDYFANMLLSLKLTDGRTLDGEDDVYGYLSSYDQYFSFNPGDENPLPSEMPKAGTSQKVAVSVCSDIEIIITVYYVNSEDDETPALMRHTYQPGVGDITSLLSEEPPILESPDTGLHLTVALPACIAVLCLGGILCILPRLRRKETE